VGATYSDADYDRAIRRGVRPRNATKLPPDFAGAHVGILVSEPSQDAIVERVVTSSHAV
jgi:hypothetical protein